MSARNRVQPQTVLLQTIYDLTEMDNRTTDKRPLRAFVAHANRVPKATLRAQKCSLEK
jgi:hypothetical protein